jgi:hypothetical protein
VQTGLSGVYYRKQGHAVPPSRGQATEDQSRVSTRREACRWLLLYVAVLSAADTSVLAAQEASPYAKLSGVWKGTYSWLQRGSCTLYRSPRLDSLVEVSVTVLPTGALEAKVTSARVIRDIRRADAYAQFPVEGDSGFGQFKPDLTFDLRVPIRTRCNGVLRQPDMDYSGKVTDAKGGLKMEFEGDLVPCPDEAAQCRFKSRVSLRKK